MNETKELLRRGVGEFEPMPDAFDRVLARRDRRHRNQRVAAGVVGIAVIALVAIGFVRLFGSERTPATDPQSPFLGVWVPDSVDDPTQTMIVGLASEDEASPERLTEYGFSEVFKKPFDVALLAERVRTLAEAKREDM